LLSSKSQQALRAPIAAPNILTIEKRQHASLATTPKNDKQANESINQSTNHNSQTNKQAN
jgi:hypothetical protein